MNIGKGILFLLHICCVVGHVTVAPRNAAVVAGDKMSLECRTDMESRVRKWDLLKANGETVTIYSHGFPSPFHANYTHFDVEVNANGSGILYTNSTKIDDAGLFTCLVREGPKGTTLPVSAQLTVFESLPNCETNLTADGNETLEVGDYIWFRCSVSFRGFWTPTMEWIRHSGNGDAGIILANGVEIERLPNNSIVSTFTVVVDSSMNGVSFSCKTYFSEYSENSTVKPNASNIPDFSNIWNSSVVQLGQSNNPGSETHTQASGTALPTDWALLTAGLSVFLILLAIFVVVLGVQYRDKLFVNKRAKPDLVQHEYHNITQDFTYIATHVESPYSEVTFDRPAQLTCNVELQPLPEHGVAKTDYIASLVESHYAEVTFDQPEQRNTEIGQLPENGMAKTGREIQPGPSYLYATVNKVNAREPQPRPNPVYSTVNKVNEPKVSVGNFKTDAGKAAEIHQTSNTYTGSDATQYIDVNKLRDSSISRFPVKQSTMFSVVGDYATIDHTLDVPPPPIPTRSQRPT